MQFFSSKIHLNICYFPFYNLWPLRIYIYIYIYLYIYIYIYNQHHHCAASPDHLDPLDTPPYRKSILESRPGYTLHQHRADVYIFSLVVQTLVVQPLLIRVKGSAGVHCLWAFELLEIELFMYMKMDLALKKLQLFMYHKPNQTKPSIYVK